MREYKETCMQALRQMRGDDLERAKHAFRGKTQEEMDKEYGQSGQTCRQILEEYEQHVKRVTEAMEWLKTV